MSSALFDISLLPSRKGAEVSVHQFLCVVMGSCQQEWVWEENIGQTSGDGSKSKQSALRCFGLSSRAGNPQLPPSSKTKHCPLFPIPLLCSFSGQWPWNLPSCFLCCSSCKFTPLSNSLNSIFKVSVFCLFVCLKQAPLCNQG